MNWRGPNSIWFLVSLIFVMMFISIGSAAAQKYDLKPYSPLRKGITWNYLQTYNDGSKNYEVFCVGGTEVVDGKTTKKIWEFDSGELESYDYGYECKAWTLEGLKLYKSATSAGDYIIFDPPLIILPATMRVGKTFQHTSTRTEHDPTGTVVNTGPHSIELTLVGKEAITVKSGQYNCLKFSGREFDMQWWDFTIWLAPGVGEVKRVYTGLEDRELISFTKGDTTRYPVD